VDRARGELFTRQTLEVMQKNIRPVVTGAHKLAVRLREKISRPGGGPISALTEPVTIINIGIHIAYIVLVYTEIRIFQAHLHPSGLHLYIASLLLSMTVLLPCWRGYDGVLATAQTPEPESGGQCLPFSSLCKTSWIYFLLFDPILLVRERVELISLVDRRHFLLLHNDMCELPVREEVVE
jgi:hypothetical protein